MKIELRKELKKLRDAVEEKAIKDSFISEQLFSLTAFKNAETVLLYYSAGSEVSTKEIFRQCLKNGKKVAFPICLDNNGIMDFFIVNDENDLCEGMYGIKAPSDGCSRLEATDNCICIVPGLAFDNNGYRIGYGKGYYDRYLSNFPGLSVGLCYEVLHLDSIPVNRHDIKVNYLITDKMIYNYNSKEDLKHG